jgi:NAD(P)-dependent dehydrogenase (short-subunit alcohol dehydrogenase family)
LDGTVSRINARGGDAVGVVVDSTKVESVRHLREESLMTYGQIDVLYATPGTNVRKRIENYTYEEFDRVVNLNLKGTFIVMKEIGAAIAKNATGGSIILFSSIRNQLVEPGQSVYAATKAAIVQLARVQAAELAEKNVRVNALAPGYVDTPLVAQIKEDPEWYAASRQKNALKRWATVEEIVGPAIFLASPAASHITGTVIYVDGGWTAVDGRYDPKV